MRIIAVVCLALSTISPVQAAKYSILSAQTATGGAPTYVTADTLCAGVCSKSVSNRGVADKTITVHGATSSGAGSATVNIYVGSDATNAGILACTITVVLSTITSGDSCLILAAWEVVGAQITAISGTGASINVIANY